MWSHQMHILEQIAASNRARLRDMGRQINMETRFLEQRFVLERFLHRLSLTQHWSSEFTLKGGLLMIDLCGGMLRPTDDLDLHMEHALSSEEIRNFVTQVASTPPTEEDGLLFNNDIKMTTIIEAHIPGHRIRFSARWANAKPSELIPVKIDMAWGDTVLDAVKRELPAVLPKMFEAVNLPSYRWEQVLAEKIHALARHGANTSRMKDFFDLAGIANYSTLDAGIASIAIKQTFISWGKPQLSSNLEVFEQDFPLYAQKHWQAFCVRKNGVIGALPHLADTIEIIKPLVLPLMERLERNENIEGIWIPNSGWDFIPNFKPF
jgi:Nucleotidyl transferase AbiEii toxin, Type IV TA system